MASYITKKSESGKVALEFLANRDMIDILVLTQHLPSGISLRFVLAAETGTWIVAC